MIPELLEVADTVEGPNPLRRNLVGLVAEAVLQGVGFALLVPVLDSLLDGDPADAWPWLGVLAAVVAVYSVVRFRTQLAAYLAAIGLGGALFERLGDHIATLPLGWFDTARIGQIGRLTSQGVVDVMGVPAHLLRPIVSAFVTPTTVIALMFLFDWRLALAALVSAPVAAVVYRWSNARVARADVGHDAAAADASARVVEFAQNQPVLRAFGRTVEGSDLLDDALQHQRDATRHLMLVGLPGIMAFVLVVQAAFTVLLVLGADLALGGTVGVAELIAVLVLAVRYVEPLVVAADLGAALRMSGNTVQRMEELLSFESLPEPTEAVEHRDPAGASVQLDGVSFGYGERRVLEDVSLTVEPGTMTALVGRSGSGKTTVTRLIARFWDVDSGAVRVGGIDVRDLPTDELMAQLSMVFQDVYLFDGSILENIRMGRPGATDDEVRRAGTLARCDEIVDRLPGGWLTEVGERGASLSGGERQRVSIARAILKDAPIVLLDEATSALDPENEAAVHQALSVLTSDKTLIVIAHRLSTVVAADQIVVLDDGRIVERGTHQELLQAAGEYARFWNERQRAAGWRLLPGTRRG